MQFSTFKIDDIFEGIDTGWPPRGRYTREKATDTTYGHTVATPREWDGTMLIEIAQLDERRDLGKFFSAV